uniref:StAR related lipid transfer domain containing 13 n=1 Tax=Saimiri boliviensis boliviensis TaxID=39432 RepID=A0A2K6UUZ5_SAIBB
MTSKRKPCQTQLRRSISEHLRDSTARAWDLLWKNVRERRLAGLCLELGSDHHVQKTVLEKKVC